MPFNIFKKKAKAVVPPNPPLPPAIVATYPSPTKTRSPSQKKVEAKPHSRSTSRNRAISAKRAQARPPPQTSPARRAAPAPPSNKQTPSPSRERVASAKRAANAPAPALQKRPVAAPKPAGMQGVIKLEAAPHSNPRVMHNEYQYQSISSTTGLTGLTKKPVVANTANANRWATINSGRVRTSTASKVEGEILKGKIESASPKAVNNYKMGKDPKTGKVVILSKTRVERA